MICDKCKHFNVEWTTGGNIWHCRLYGMSAYRGRIKELLAFLLFVINCPKVELK